MNIIGRQSELEILSECRKSKKSELIAVYGRRRVGKTYLIREFYADQIVFEVTGLYESSLQNQLSNFTKELRKQAGSRFVKHTPKKWLDAFTLLEEWLNKLQGKKKKVVFIDEFPWIATQKSGFLTAFENFWNAYASKRRDLIVVICGSAASYMVNKVLRNKGGLHNRVTEVIRLLPFNLSETEQFLKSRNVSLSRYDVVRLYMCIGGIPHYLDKVKKGKTVSQIVNDLCFSENGALRKEFHHLFSSLFVDSERHTKIVQVLSTTRKGLTRNQILKRSGTTSGGDFSKRMDELIESGFVTEYAPFEKRIKHALYRLTDEYALFYLTFVEQNRKTGTKIWQSLHQSKSYQVWSGFSFESVCFKHIDSIKKSLGISGMHTTCCSWSNSRSQIDMLINRSDGVVNICEIKFTNAPFTITKSYSDNLRKKLWEFSEETKTNKMLLLTTITTFGIKENKHSTELTDSNLKLDDLFGK